MLMIYPQCMLKRVPPFVEEWILLQCLAYQDALLQLNSRTRCPTLTLGLLTHPHEYSQLGELVEWWRLEMPSKVPKLCLKCFAIYSKKTWLVISWELECMANILIDSSFANHNSTSNASYTDSLFEAWKPSMMACTNIVSFGVTKKCPALASFHFMTIFLELVLLWKFFTYRSDHINSIQ